MSKASVHNLRNARMQPDDVYIGRRTTRSDGYFGNPFVLRSEHERSTVIARFRAYAEERVANDAVYRERVRGLHGKRLFCYCAPLACHGDVLAELAAKLAAESEVRQ